MIELTKKGQRMMRRESFNFHKKAIISMLEGEDWFGAAKSPRMKNVLINAMLGAFGFLEEDFKNERENHFC